MTANKLNRRDFIKKTSMATAALSLSGVSAQAFTPPKDPLFKISLAEWSINKPLFAGKIDHLDFPVLSKKHGIEAIEYVNQFFMDKAQDKAYLKEMKTRAEGEGVTSVLIMCDREGLLGDAEEKTRIQTVENHKKWVEAAKFLGCHSIRINAYSSIPWSQDKQAFKESQALVADGLYRMCEFAKGFGIDVIIENHGGFTSDGKWLAGLMKAVDHPSVGTLPDFGNFQIGKTADGTIVSYDAYKGVKKLMPFAKGVSVKTKVWDGKGNQSPLDYTKMMKIVLNAGFHGYCGIEHGEPGREWESIVEVKEALLKVQQTLV
ncbi:MAG: TIM barrel protein [Saprospiraceae bacterium]